MSHEVRTPLNSIVGFSQVLASEFRDKPATGEYASIIEANSATLLRLFDDVLEVAYLDQTGDLPRCDVTALNNLCNDCVESTLPELHPGVSLLDELPVSDPVVRTNLKRIEQVLLHLLTAHRLQAPRSRYSPTALQASWKCSVSRFMLPSAS